MTSTALPQTFSDISVEWLNQVLGDANALGESCVKGFEREVIGEGVGFVGELSRVTLSYDRFTDKAPKTIIAKLPTQDETFRGLATLMGFYEREVRFYQEIAGKLNLRTPACYFSEMDQASGSYVLLLEDLAPGRCGDQLASCSMEEAKLALSEVAKLHAAWWGSSELENYDWMLGLDNDQIRQLLLGMYQNSWPLFVQEFGDEMPPPMIEIGEKFGEQFEALAAGALERPLTIVHSDFRLDNMFFDVAGGSSPFVLIDWQLIQKNVGTLDVAYFLAGNFPTDVRREHQTELLEHYYSELVKHGVSGYGMDQCWEDYRRAMLFLLLFLVPNRENFNLDDLNERGQALMSTIMERYMTAIVDVNAGEFLAD